MRTSAARRPGRVRTGDVRIRTVPDDERPFRATYRTARARARTGTAPACRPRRASPRTPPRSPRGSRRCPAAVRPRRDRSHHGSRRSNGTPDRATSAARRMSSNDNRGFQATTHASDAVDFLRRREPRTARGPAPAPRSRRRARARRAGPDLAQVLDDGVRRRHDVGRLGRDVHAHELRGVVACRTRRVVRDEHDPLAPLAQTPRRLPRRRRPASSPRHITPSRSTRKRVEPIGQRHARRPASSVGLRPRGRGTRRRGLPIVARASLVVGVVRTHHVRHPQVTDGFAEPAEPSETQARAEVRVVVRRRRARGRRVNCSSATANRPAPKYARASPSWIELLPGSASAARSSSVAAAWTSPGLRAAPSPAGYQSYAGATDIRQTVPARASSALSGAGVEHAADGRRSSLQRRHVRPGPRARSRAGRRVRRTT